MILLKNGRRKLREAQERLNGGLRIVQQQRRRARAEAVRGVLASSQRYVISICLSKKFCAGRSLQLGHEYA